MAMARTAPNSIALALGSPVDCFSSFISITRFALQRNVSTRSIRPTTLLQYFRLPRPRSVQEYHVLAGEMWWSRSRPTIAYVPLGGALISANGSKPQLTHLEAAVDSSGREIFRNRVSRQPSSSKLARSSGSRGKRPHRFKPKVDCPRFRGSGPGPLRPIDRTLNCVGGKLVDLVRSMATRA